MGKFSRKNAEYKLSETSAMVQIDTFLDGYGIDPDARDDEQKSIITTQLEKLLKYIRLGYVEIADNLTITQNLKDPPGDVPTIVYKKLKGKNVIDSDGAGKGEKYNEKLHALLGSLCGDGPAVFQTLGPIDLSVAEVLGLLFLAR